MDGESRTGAAPAVGGEDVDQLAGAVDDAPEQRRAEMAEDCALADGEHGRHPAPSLSQRRVAEGIDAEVEGM